MTNNALNNVTALNKILKGEYMAIATYEKYLQKVKDDKLAAELNRILEDHKSHAFILSARVKELGEDPENTGLGGVMLDFMTAVKTAVDTDSLDILKELYGGENKGIASALEIADKQLAEYDRQLVEEMMAEDYTHLKTLNNLIEDQTRNVIH